MPLTYAELEVENARLRRELQAARAGARGDLTLLERLLPESLPDAIVLFRLDDGHMGEILEATPAAATLTGYPIEELCRRRVPDLVVPAMAAGFLARVALLKTERVLEAEGEIVHKDGHPVPVWFRNTAADIDGRLVAVTVMRDLTARRRLERERAAAVTSLQASEERYRSVFDNAGEAILVYALTGERAGHILAANQAAAAITGYSAAELGTMALADVTGGEARAAIPDRLRTLLATGRASGASRILRRDGTEVEAAFESTVIELDGARVALGFGRDTTLERRAEEAMRQAKEAAEQANRAKSAFLASMSHEIRTPMNAVLGYAQLLARDPTLTEEQRGYLGIIGRSGDHLLDMINDVLEMSKIEAGVRELHQAAADLPALFDDIGRMFQLRASAKGIDFFVRIDHGVPRQAVVDEGKLRQVVVNLLSNAVRLTRSGGVDVRVSLEETGPRPALAVEVEDTGPGIADHEIAQLFRPFEQTRAGAAAGGGTGLGLALSRELVRLMGGAIGVQSRVGVGSVFRFTVPVEPLEPGPASTARGVPGSHDRVVGISRGGRPRVLVADDSEEGRAWMSLLLRQIGFEVREAADGRQAIAVHDAWGPEIVLMDLQMPGMDGYEAIRAIRARAGTAAPTTARGAAPTIVAVTASAFDDTRDAIFAAGADAWLRKPCRAADLLDTLRRHAGVEYVYEEGTAPPPGASGPPPEPLPLDLAAPILAAAHIADLDALRALVEALPAAHASARRALTALADAFAYDRIEAMLTRAPPASPASPPPGAPPPRDPSSAPAPGDPRRA